MDEDICQKERKALGDVTNQLGKRGVSTFLGGGEESFVGIKRLNTGKSILVNEKEGVKRVCVFPRSSSEINSLKVNAISGISKAIGENIEHKKKYFAQDEVKDALASNRSPIILHSSKNDVYPRKNALVHDGDELKEISISAVPKGYSDNVDLIVDVSSGADDTGTSSEAGDESENYCEILELSGGPNKEYGDKRKSADTDDEVVVSLDNANSDTDLLPDDGDQHGVDDLVQSQTGSVDHNRLPLSQESRCFGLERCTNPKGGDCSNTNAVIEMIKACTCSFCTKAAYIWTDLHYQDFKARIATIKKSEKEASLFAERNCRSMDTEKHGNTPQIATGVSSLESELMGQWTSLFSQMEKIYEHEGNHLEASLLSLKNLRAKCKEDIKFLNGPAS